MTRIFTVAIFTFLAMNITAQNNFDNGYYINSNEDRIEGYVLNEEWKLSPKEISFKETMESNVERLKMSDIKGFGIGNTLQYDVFTVKIFNAPKNINNLIGSREFKLEQKTIPLKLIVDGDAQLYEYSNEENTLYFLKENNSITTLLYKRYLQKGKVYSNNQYQQQLKNKLSCETGNIGSLKNLNYNYGSLKKYVTKYNLCNNSLNNSFTVTEKKSVLAIKLLAGVSQNSLSIESNRRRTFDFGDQTSLFPGIELEVKFPSNKKIEWTVFLDARPLSFEEKSTIPLTTNFTRTTSANYDAVDIGFGGRGYHPLVNNSKIFFEGSIGIDFITETSIKYNELGVSDFTGKGSSITFGLGAGFNWKRLNLGLRYNTNRNIIEGENFGRYSNLAFTLSYSIFNLSL